MDDVDALVGMAISLQLLKQTPKARNALKRIAKMTYMSENAESFERAFLLLAHLYIQVCFG